MNHAKLIGMSAICLGLLLPSSAKAVFTGDDQYRRTNLDTESLLDTEYLIALLAFRPFWRPPPAAEIPRAWARTTDGSLNEKRFYIERDVGVRGSFGGRHFGGYHLRQLEDLEQNFFYQSFEVQAQAFESLAFRILGEPTGHKASSDLGAGAELSFGESRLRWDVTAVDLYYSSKNLDSRRDRRKLYNSLFHAQSRFGSGSIEAAFEWDSPVEREYDDEGTLFGHKESKAHVRAVFGSWDAEAGWQNGRRTLDPLAGGPRLQDFRQEIFRGELAWNHRIKSRELRLGTQVQRRESDFESSDAALTSNTRQRWEADPYISLMCPWGKKMKWELTAFHGLVWEKTRLDTRPPAEGFFFQAKAKTTLRINFTPDVSLALNPTWDLDKLGTGHAGLGFDGGNVQFEARIP